MELFSTSVPQTCPSPFYRTDLKQPPFPITISRCRPLNISRPSSHRNEIKEKVTLALNGRKGRRVGCIMMGEGREVEVLDMDQDEDADDGNNEDDESGMEGVEDG